MAFDWHSLNLGDYVKAEVPAGHRPVHFLVTELFDGNFSGEEPVYSISGGHIGYADEWTWEGWGYVTTPATEIRLEGRELTGNKVRISTTEYDFKGVEIASDTTSVDVDKNRQIVFTYKPDQLG